MFGGDAGCEHVWGAQFARTVNPQRDHNGKGDFGTTRGQESWRNGAGTTQNQGAFCSLCGAWKGQLGLEPTPELYVAHLMEYLRAIWRVLRDDGTLWLNLGDSYANTKQGNTNEAPDKRPRPYFEEGTHRMQFKKQIPPGLKPKDLVMIPFRVALAAQADGWWVRSVIIWSKPNPMPESVRDRPTTAHEYVFLLTKSKTYFYDADAIREPHAEKSFTVHTTPRKGTGVESKGERFNSWLEEPGRGRQLNPAGRNKRTVWEIATAAYSGAHYATFPPKLVEPMILTTPTKVCAECGAGYERVTELHDPEGRLGKGYHDHADDLGRGQRGVFPAKGAPTRTTLGFRPTCSCNAQTKPAVILDPFCGRGTVLKEARAKGRDWIGIDVDPQSIKLAEEWLGLGPVEYETPEESWIQPRLTITEPG